MFVELLLEKDADVNAMSKYSETPLMYCLKRSNSEFRRTHTWEYQRDHGAVDERAAKVLDMLRYGGAELDTIDEYGNTPLHIAVRRSFVVSVRRLLAYGAAVDVRNKKGETPLLMAVDLGHEKIEEILLAKSADINIRSQDGRTPRGSIIRRGRRIAAELSTRGIDVVDIDIFDNDIFDNDIFDDGAIDKDVSGNYVSFPRWLIIRRGRRIVAELSTRGIDVFNNDVSDDDVPISDGSANDKCVRDEVYSFDSEIF
ncbi:ankyrin repeat-containing domain protein [Astrocystis sublimbata]|nr:ankyrin repeat-containing domain protein [Astrocystis sublimbata]